MISVYDGWQVTNEKLRWSQPPKSTWLNGMLRLNMFKWQNKKKVEDERYLSMTQLSLKKKMKDLL